jgi:ligand-binding sensor domain-containing protein
VSVLPTLIICSSLVLGVHSLSAAVAPVVITAPWLARAWQTDDGLPDNSVCGVAQTPDGYLWVATYGGLVRFDGVRFEELSPVNIPGVPNRVVRALFLDQHGRLWLGMDRGPVVCVEPDGARVFTAKDGLPDLPFAMMTEDGQGAIWIAYGNGIVARIKDGRVTLLGSSEGLPGRGSCSLATDTKGQLWFTRGGHVGTFREGRFHTLVTLDEPAACVGPARAGGIWICAGERIIKFDEGYALEERGRLPTGSGGIEPKVLLEDHNGAVWIGTTADGLFRYDRVGETFASVTPFTPGSGGTPTLSISRSGNQVEISWSAGTLESATSATGPWSVVAGAVSPSYKVTPDEMQRYFRARR